MDKDTKTQKLNAQENYPGVAMDIADNEKDTKKLQQQDTHMLNNNPRNSDGPND